MRRDAKPGKGETPDRCTDNRRQSPTEEEQGQDAFQRIKPGGRSENALDNQCSGHRRQRIAESRSGELGGIERKHRIRARRVAQPPQHEFRREVDRLVENEAARRGDVRVGDDLRTALLECRDELGRHGCNDIAGDERVSGTQPDTGGVKRIVARCDPHMACHRAVLLRKAELIVQRKAGQEITAAVAGPFADADHLLLTGRYGAAVQRLREAYGKAGER